MHRGREIVLGGLRMNKERQELKDSAMGVAMDHYTSTEVNNLLIYCILNLYCQNTSAAVHSHRKN